VTRDQANARIIHSRRVFYGWRQTPPAGRAEDTLRLVNEEIAVLDGIATQFPDKAGTLGMLVRDWKEMAEGLRMKAN
jgi:hypothetical protein